MKARTTVILMSITLAAVSACTSGAPSRSLTAQQNLTSAQAQATNAALDDSASAAATQQARDRNNAAIAAATNQSYNATQQAINATRVANDATISALSVEQQRNDATAQARRNESAVAISINAATATAQAIDRQARLEADDAQRKSAEARATSTAVAKAAEDDSKASYAKQDAELTFWVGWLIKIGLAIIALIGLLTIIEAIRKHASVMHIGNYTVAVDGGAVGKMEAYLLMPEQPKPLMIAAPATEVAPAQSPGNFVVNQSRIVPSMSDEEYDARQHWRLQMIRFLQDAIKSTNSDYNRIPPCSKMGVQSARWVELTDTIDKWIDKRERQPTMCLPPYETLGKLLLAVSERRITPLPPHLRVKYGGNSGKQETAQQETDAVEQQKQRETAQKQIMDDAVGALPENKREQWSTT